MPLSSPPLTLPSPDAPPLPSEQALDATVRAAERLAAVQLSVDWREQARAGWDSLTQLAVRLLKVPASFVAVVGADQDSYPSHSGLPPALGTPALIEGRTFCHYTLALDRTVVITDTRADARLSQVPTVDALGVRAYVGVPLHVGGQAIGSFCVIDVVPRVWDELALDVIAQLAAAAERELTLHMALAQREAEADRARQLALRREELVAVVSHDLRTPLQVLLLLARQLHQRVGPAEQLLVQRLMQAGDAMRRLADDLLCTHSLDTGTRAQRLVSGRALVAAAITLMQPIADRAGTVLEAGAGPDAWLLVDEAEMLRVLANLIGNALKYAGNTSPVRIDTAQRGVHYVIGVSDEGCGMSEADCAQAFESGWQGAAGLSRGDGAGLGLGIVRTLVERQGGQVSLRSTLGAGTRVEVQLPAQADGR